MPSPIETLLRVHHSPVPTQIVFGACGSIAIAPIDCDVCLSNTGLNVVPPFTDFHTPPLAAPMYTVKRPSSFTAVSAATRPLIAAEPILRAPSPEMESESNFASCAARLPGYRSTETRIKNPTPAAIDLQKGKRSALSLCRMLFVVSRCVQEFTVHLLPASLQVW